MKTKIIKIDLVKPERKKIDAAAKIIKRGGIVAFPTETVYGLGADATNEVAVKKIYVAKGRPADNPMIVHIADKKDLYNLCTEVPPKALQLIKKFWPGPLTLVMKKSKIVPYVVTAGRETVAIRMPSNRIAHELIKAAGVPLAAPSANLSGRPSATAAGHVIEDFLEHVDMIIDGGETEVGLESTVIDVTGKTPMLLRPGKITPEELRKITGISIHPSVRKTKSVSMAKSPGMKYKHYSPRAEVILVEGKKRLDRIGTISRQFSEKGKNVAILATKKGDYDARIVIVLNNPKKFAHHLFASFRDCDKKNIDVIIVEGISEKKLGLAIMNRLRKAASHTIRAK